MSEAATMYVSAAEAALRLSISRSLIRKLIRTGKLPCRRVRGTRLVRVAVTDVDALLEDRTLLAVEGKR